MNIPELDTLIDEYRTSTNSSKMIEMAHEMEEIIHDDAAFVPAFVIPFYRVGYWRWRHYPDDFDVMQSSSSSEFGFGWMDVEEKKATLKAKRSGETFEKSIEVYDQYENR
jgi:microcin C transport system substrate-binding protein